MASDPGPTASSEQEWVVIASFPNRHAAERMLASLGPGFCRNANKGHAEAFVITGNADGSLKLTKSRVLEAGGLACTVARIAVFVMVGLIGVVAMFKGAKARRTRPTNISRTSGPMNSTPTRCSLKLDRMRPSP